MTDEDIFFATEAKFIFNDEFDFVAHGLEIHDFNQYPEAEIFKTITNKKRRKKARIFYQQPYCVFCNAQMRWLFIGHSRDSTRIIFVMDNYELATIDHIKPRGLGGVDNLSNYQTACQHCNTLKSKQPNQDFIRKIQNGHVNLWGNNKLWIAINHNW